jgi:hypothetical protein
MVIFCLPGRISLANPPITVPITNAKMTVHMNVATHSTISCSLAIDSVGAGYSFVANGDEYAIWQNP